jgi:hypothetical protein
MFTQYTFYLVLEHFKNIFTMLNLSLTQYYHNILSMQIKADWNTSPLCFLQNEWQFAFEDCFWTAFNDTNTFLHFICWQSSHDFFHRTFEQQLLIQTQSLFFLRFICWQSEHVGFKHAMFVSQAMSFILANVMGMFPVCWVSFNWWVCLVQLPQDIHPPPPHTHTLSTAGPQITHMWRHIM